MSTIIESLADAEYCYLTTTGRVSGRPHTIEIWFALQGTTLYMLAGGRTSSDWVKNALRTPQVQLRIGEQNFAGHARLVTGNEEDGLARRLVVAKYQPGYGSDLSGWGQSSLPVVVDLVV